MNIRQLLDDRLTAALHRAGAPDSASALVRQSARPEFGDYQANGVMAVAKQLNRKPRELAEQILAHVDLSDLAEKVEIAGPGFLNIHLKNSYLANSLKNKSPVQVTPQRIVVDYSSPNLAKEMHVGHLRSTIIGDAIARVLRHLGHTVIAQNHVGDWGTQFGMLLAHLEDVQAQGSEVSMQLKDLESFYRAAKIRFDEEPSFKQRATDTVVKLQAGEPQYLQLWEQFINVSLHHCEEIYQRLGVGLTRADVKAESSYNADLPNVVRLLTEQGLLTESDGAQCVFMDEFRKKDGGLDPFIIQKSDGGYLYATTDLAALRYRNDVLKAERILYFVDIRQSHHFQQLFTLVRKTDFVNPAISLEYMPFGMMMGEDGKPFKTRTGGTVRLADLLDEAEERAYQLVSDKSPDLSDAEKRDIAHKVGIGSVKYADLSKNRNSDYVFSWSAMLSLEGNTAPYLQYAYARIRSIFRKLGSEAPDASIQLTEAAERALAVRLLQFDETLLSVAKDGLPNQLCLYLYELAGNFMTFYEACPILKDDVPTEVRAGRLQLAHQTAQTLKQGLGLLGIEVMERM